MAKYKHQQNGHLWQRILGRPWWQYLIAVLIFVVFGFMIQRFISQGTILGYKVRDVRSADAIKRDNNSGALTGDAKASTKTAKACTEISVDKMSTAIDDTMKVVGSFAADITEPNLVSSCIFTSKTTKTTVAILIREFSDQDKAKKTVDALAKSQDIEQVSGQGDQAIYNTAANQLTVRKGARVTTITVTKNSKEKFDNKATALQIASILP